MRYAGEWSPFIYVVCALLILLILLCFAELASYYRGTGGPIRYVTDAFGSFIGFQAGWLFYVARIGSFSANSVLLVDSVGYFFPAVARGSMRLAAARTNLLQFHVHQCHRQCACDSIAGDIDRREI